MPIAVFMKFQNLPRSESRVRNLCIVIATSIALPALAYAKNDKDTGRDKGDKGEHKGKGSDIPVVPEANAGWVLVPFFGAVLLFSTRQFLRTKADQRNGC